MSTINLKPNFSSGVTLVKNLFIDHYMINANGEYVKIYLYLLRCLNEPEFSTSMSIHNFADIFDCTEKDILRALKYWEHVGLVSLEFSGDTLSAISLNEPKQPGSRSQIPVPQISTTVDSPVSGPSELSAARLSRLVENQEVKQLLFIAQKYLEKTLNASETNTILYFYDTLALSADLIEYLLEYCVTNDHKSFRYIEKTGIAWHEMGIRTREQAKEYTENFSKTYFSILKAFGISGRMPAPVEKEFIDKWTNIYGFHLDVILEACNRTINTIHQPSFKYADSILSRWKDKNVHTLGDLKHIDSAHEKMKERNARNAAQAPASPKKTSFHNFSQRDYDFNQLEKELLNR